MDDLETEGPGTGASDAAGDAETWDLQTAAQWYDHLTAGQQWQGWNGRDEDWSEFRSGFLYYAEAADVLVAATRLLDGIEQAREGKRRALLALGIAVCDFPTPDVEWGEQTAAWYQYLTNDSQVAGWDGSEADWGPFRERFLTSAEAAAVVAPARAFLARIEDAPDKVGACAELGVPLTAG